MRRLGLSLAAVLLLAGAGVVGYLVGTQHSDGSGGSSACSEVVARETKLQADANELARQMPESAIVYEDVQRRKSMWANVGALLEERAILVSQNPTCFSPTDRASTEAVSRRWNASSP